MASPKLTLKLLIEKKTRKVLFAEAGKDVVDFLFNLLALPVGTVVRLLTKGGMVGSIANLYQSVQNLNDTYVDAKHSKDMLLNPKASICVAQVPLLPAGDDTAAPQRTFYGCGGNSYNQQHYYVAERSGAVCPACSSGMSRMLQYVAPPPGAAAAAGAVSGGGGYVKGVVTYMVMDDLVVKPMSTISSIALLNEFNIKDLGALEEKPVTMGMNEGVNLLKASLQTKNVLTTVFLGNKA